MLAFADGRIDNMYTYQSLEHVSDQIITECFNLAFSDYELPMYLTEEILRLIFTKSCVDKNILSELFVKMSLSALSLTHAVYRMEKRLSLMREQEWYQPTEESGFSATSLSMPGRN